MQSIHLIQLCVAALGGALVGVVAERWYGGQRIGQLQQRLARSEEARNGAIERSMHAREQIAQLSKAISDLRKAHHTVRSSPVSTQTTSADERRALAERTLEAAADRDAKPASVGPIAPFANTEPMRF